jgi:hypothetical protein
MSWQSVVGAGTFLFATKVPRATLTPAVSPSTLDLQLVVMLKRGRGCPRRNTAAEQQRYGDN